MHCVQPVSSAGWSCTARDRKNVDGQLQPNYVTLFNRMDYRLDSVPCRYITIHRDRKAFLRLLEDAALVEFLYLVKLYLLACQVKVTVRRLGCFLLCLYDIFRAIINSLIY